MSSSQDAMYEYDQVRFDGRVEAEDFLDSTEKITRKSETRVNESGLHHPEAQQKPMPSSW